MSNMLLNKMEFANNMFTAAQLKKYNIKDSARSIACSQRHQGEKNVTMG